MQRLHYCTNENICTEYKIIAVVHIYGQYWNWQTDRQNKQNMPLIIQLEDKIQVFFLFVHNIFEWTNITELRNMHFSIKHE